MPEITYQVELSARERELVLAALQQERDQLKSLDPKYRKRVIDEVAEIDALIARLA